MSRATIAEADACLADSGKPGPRPPREWRSMESAPQDGTVIDACARFADAAAGSPRYVFWMEGAWRVPERGLGEPLVCWAWRPRTGWPDEGGRVCCHPDIADEPWDHPERNCVLDHGRPEACEMTCADAGAFRVTAKDGCCFWLPHPKGDA